MRSSFISFVIFFLANGSAAFARDIAIEVKEIAFTPAKISAHVNDILVWTNKDFVIHSATAKNKDWDITLPAGHTEKIILKKPGHIEYYCKYHPTMTGIVEVAQ